MKKIFSFCLAALLILAGCGSQPASSAAESSGTAESVSSEAAGSASSEVSSSEEAASEEPVTILVAAAASLEYSFVDELIPMFQEKYPYITVEGTYDSSGKLQTQIEEGLEADVFMSAATKQMNALKDESLVDADSIVNLLENKIVLITAADSTSPVTTFEEIGNAQSIALGDPASVPVGQYAQEALTTLGLWDAIQPKVSPVSYTHLDVYKRQAMIPAAALNAPAR